MSSQKTYKTVEEYLSTLPEQHRKLMEILRKTIKSAAPGAEEVISYNMPAFRIKKILVYYAANKEHIGFYPASTEVQEVFREELRAYETSKGTIRFPVENGIPVELVRKIVTFRLNQIAGV